RLPIMTDDIDLKRVIGLDTPQRRHQRALLMASFIQWIAGDLEKHRATAHSEMAKLRDQLIRDGSGEELAATLGCERSGWTLMMQFLTEIEAITAQEMQAIITEADT